MVMEVVRCEELLEVDMGRYTFASRACQTIGARGVGCNDCALRSCMDWVYML
jgi:plasmid rolling circle replication initiator protein Rep